MQEHDLKISVIIACVNGLPSIAECLRALSVQEGNHDHEVIVVNTSRDGTVEHIRTHYPDVLLLDQDERLGIPALRAIGMAEATGNVYAVIEDHCMVRPNWFSEIVRALADGAQVVGGPVENGATRRLVDQAVFLTEYSDSMLPVPHGEVPGVPGNNVAYRKEVFDQVRDETLQTSWEYFIQQEMREGGVAFRSVPSMIVDHKKEFGFGYFVKQRFHYSRSFAGMRRARLSPAKRLLYGLASPLLAPMMLMRIGKQVRRKKRYQRSFVLGLPLLVPFMVSYALGEGVGYLLGGGSSLEQVE